MTERVDGYLPLRGYAVIGDGRSCALVGSDGAVDWWALPTMADDPTFGALLDEQAGGRLTLRPVADADVTRRYIDDGGVLETTFRTGSGSVRVTDALTMGVETAEPWRELARRVDGIDGEVEMTWEVAPGNRFGTCAPWARTFHSLPLITAGAQNLAVVLDAAGDPQVADGAVSGRFTARPGGRSLLAVVATDNAPVPGVSPDEVYRRIDETVEHWSRWRGRLHYDGPWADAVRRSAIVLKQLTFADSGAIQAAATTSLPERIGAGRNFDYRFAWVRDAGFALDAMTSLDLRPEVQAALSFLVSSVAKTAPDIRVFYSMRGEVTPGDVHKVMLWQGYRGSSPVQVGNNAAKQRQLGAYGDLLECVRRYCAQGNILDGSTAQVIFQTVDNLCHQWGESDAGIWELGDQQPYTSSKIGCWAAFSRAIELAESGQLPDDHVERWRSSATAVHDYVDTACWSEDKHSYTFYAGTEKLDCATLLAARTGFCGRNDPRLHSTIDAVRAELTAGGPLLYRYTGMREQEGAFLACSFWLVEALAIAGRRDEARAVMDDAVAVANDVGLLTEEVDPASRDLLGNLPQALSHLALISAAAAYTNTG